MGSIKPLPESVRSTLRSAFILFDVTRVVEELIFNSLDAAASKVSVFVSVGSSYVKVVDDGSGISRDGLVSIGERYVTSKLCHLGDLDAANRSFGFHGEALASISDVALVEIITKAYGKPNGYRKVIKGSKCLYLGIDDDRKDVGTTVVVRDLFYNQPVRRKHMQSSPKKVLNSLKKCVFRIALIHPMAYFNVIDIESEDEILSTHPSSSPLPLLMSGFGIEDSAFLQKLNATDGSLKLSGYISDPCDNFAFKAFQYVYINSRFVCKGPIHKLLDNLAASLGCLDPEKANIWLKKGKRSRSQWLLSYIMNISCPPSFYDLTFQPSKTYVEFKDWKPILTLIEKAIEQLWKKNIICADGLEQGKNLKGDDTIMHMADVYDEGPSMDLEFATTNRTQKYRPSSSLEKLAIDRLFLQGHEDKPFEECHGNIAQYKDQQINKQFVNWTDYSFQSWDNSFSKGTPFVNQRGHRHPWTSDDFSVEDYFLEDKFTASGRSNCHVKNNSISLKLGTSSFKDDSGLTNETASTIFTFDYDELSNDSQIKKDIGKPFLQNCSSQRNQLLDAEDEEGTDSTIHSFKIKRKKVHSNERFNLQKVDFSEKIFDHLSRTMWQDGESCSQICPQLIRPGCLSRDLNDLTRASPKFLSCGHVSDEENGLLFDSVKVVENFGSDNQSLSSAWHLGTSNPFDQFRYNNAIDGSFKSKERSSSEHFSDTVEKDYRFGFDLLSRSPMQESCIYDCTKTRKEIKYGESVQDFCKFIRQYNPNHKFSLDHLNVLIEERDWLHPDSNINEYERQRDRFQDLGFRQNSIPEKRSRRSQSAPPFYSQKRKFISLHHCLLTASVEPPANEVHGSCTSLEKNPPQQASSTHNQCFEPSFEHRNNKPEILGTIGRECEDSVQPHCQVDPESVSVQVLTSSGNQDPGNSGTKWGNCLIQNSSNRKLFDIDKEDNLLDITSGFLYLATESLVPKSINKKCLTDAKVLQQLDKKFIPIIAGGTLAIIDQHAADERIQLEELRQKVLSGEGRAVNYLNAEQELILPEMGYQLLHNYSEQIRHWGWICNIHAQDYRAFKKNLNLIHHKPDVVMLLAVPCILGVNLSDVDLLEFLQQLADTDGSSTMPPSVSRILNNKACRGAIMFGDSLLPSECSLIVEELKQTSLCFQCAHGRPTTVPIVNLEALHKQIAKMQVPDDDPRDPWHGLCRHRVSLERASLRLSTAGG